MFHVKFADIGEGIHEGVLYEWKVSEGSEVQDGDTLFLVETDKVTAEIPSPVKGKITKINGKVGDVIHVGETIVEIDDGTNEVSSNMALSEEEKKIEKPETVSASEGSTSVVGEIEVSSELIPSSTEATQKVDEVPKRRKALATPVARKIAKDLNIDINSIVGTGPNGRVMKADIYAAADQSKAAMEPAKEIPKEQPHVVKVTDAPVERIKLSMQRKTISKNMVKSKFTIPHTAAMIEIDVSKLVDYRASVKELALENDIRLTFMAFFTKAIVLALKAFPIVNAELDEVNEEIVLKKYYNIGMAVDTKDGLTVPVIKNADQKSIFELADSISDLTGRAREKMLVMDELTEGTFTITNYGTVGATFGVPVIKYPEAAIIGLGTITKKPVVENDEIVIRSIMPVSLSFDHRIIDGADAGRFLGYFKELLSNPQLLLLK